MLGEHAHRFDPPDLLPVEIDPKGGKTPFILGCDLTYKSAIVTVKVKKGFRYDMASIPRMLWPFIARTDPRIVRAATIHDHLYDGRLASRAVADSIFLEIMQFDCMPWLKRWAAYLAVRIFGGRAWRGNELN